MSNRTSRGALSPLPGSPGPGDPCPEVDPRPTSSSVAPPVGASLCPPGGRGWPDAHRRAGGVRSRNCGKRRFSEQAQESFDRGRRKKELVTQSCPTLCNPMDCHPPGSMGFSRQEDGSGLLCPSPGDLPDPGIKPRWTSLPSEPPGKPKGLQHPVFPGASHPSTNWAQLCLASKIR